MRISPSFLSSSSSCVALVCPSFPFPPSDVLVIACQNSSGLPLCTPHRVPMRARFKRTNYQTIACCKGRACAVHALDVNRGTFRRRSDAARAAVASRILHVTLHKPSAQVSVNGNLAARLAQASASKGRPHFAKYEWRPTQSSL